MSTGIPSFFSSPGKWPRLPAGPALGPGVWGAPRVGDDGVGGCDALNALSVADDAESGAVVSGEAAGADRGEGTFPDRQHTINAGLMES